MPHPFSLPDLAQDITDIAMQAGEITLRYFKTKLVIEEKTDTTQDEDYSSPVTVADQQTERYIIEHLSNITPDIPIVGEESTSEGNIPEINGRYFWLVDPLDGTREFISQSGEFTVNIALIEDGKPILGVVYAPALGEIYVGYENTAFLIKDSEKNPSKFARFPILALLLLPANDMAA